MTSNDERHDWYKEANIFAKQLPIDLNKACGVIAALSPVKQWEQNKTCAMDMIWKGDCGHMGQFKDKARRIIEGSGEDKQVLSILKGNKISSFYLNIRYPEKADTITVDRHALSISLGKWVTKEEQMGMTKAQYEFFVECFTNAAKQVNVSPLVMQSATWVKWRQIKQEYKQ